MKNKLLSLVVLAVITLVLLAILARPVARLIAADEKTDALPQLLHHRVIVTIKRPWLQIGETVLIRLSDEEWVTLVAAYPDAVRNADSKLTYSILALK